jgi:mono/diheme cytochrome c family protein
MSYKNGVVATATKTLAADTTLYKYVIRVKSMNQKKLMSSLAICSLAVLGTGNAWAGTKTSDAASLERGKYLVELGGCNDCHTPDYLLSGGKTPEAQWLTGSSFGWHGPWGTTYAVNLRELLPTFTEDQWVDYAKKLKARPPMPWYTVNKLKDEDLRAIYRYVVHLGPGGSPAPAYLPPGQQPPQPYASFPSPPPQQHAAAQ